MNYIPCVIANSALNRCIDAWILCSERYAYTVDRSFLNYRGLHLNHDGSKLLQENIANILTSNKLNEHGRGSPLLIHP